MNVLSVPNSRQKAFFAALILTTLLPLVGLPVLSGFGFVGDGVLMTILILVSGPGHVGTSLLFYADKDYAQIRKENGPRFWWAPIVLSAAVFALAATVASVYHVFVLFFQFWQLHHYQRQNYGVLSFVQTATGGGSLPLQLKPVLNGSVVAGYFGALHMLGLYDVVSRSWFDRLVSAAWYAGVVVYAITIIAAAFILLREPRLRRSPLFVLFYIASVLFYAPTLWSRDPLVCFWSYAAAHGLQYLLFTVCVAGTSRDRMAIPATIGFTLAGIFVFNSAVMGPAYLGVVMTHFLVDARVWRLRDALPRSLIRSRLPYLFPPGAQTAQSS